MCCNTICLNIYGRPRGAGGATDAVARVLPGLAAALASVLFVSSQAHAAGPDRLETVVANDNTRAAGVVDRGTVMIRVRAARGRWAPEGPDGPVLTIEAFGEEGSALTVPAPLIRIVEGTIVAVSLRNDLDAPLRVYGLCTRDGGVCAPLDVPPGVTRDVRFSSGRAGTYHYWATSMGSPIPTRELAGAFVVDPPGGSADPDRIFVITEHAEFHRPSSSCSPAGQPERRCPEHALSRRSSWRSSGRGCSS